jgi:prolyl-tRNA editing enzyme YbaK/EbsC (Cys-tRNA(Pro) deacylase)
MMGIEAGLDTLLRSNGVDYSMVRRTTGGQERWAERSPPVAPACIAKTVLLADDRGEAIAVIPSDRTIDLRALADEFGRTFRVVAADHAGDGTSGSRSAVQASGTPFETYVDQFLVALPEVHVRMPNGDQLARIDGESFRSLFYGAWCGHISRPRCPA